MSHSLGSNKEDWLTQINCTKVWTIVNIIESPYGLLYTRGHPWRWREKHLRWLVCPHNFVRINYKNELPFCSCWELVPSFLLLHLWFPSFTTALQSGCAVLSLSLFPAFFLLWLPIDCSLLKKMFLEESRDYVHRTESKLKHYNVLLSTSLLHKKILTKPLQCIKPHCREQASEK